MRPSAAIRRKPELISFGNSIDPSGACMSSNSRLVAPPFFPRTNSKARRSVSFIAATYSCRRVSPSTHQCGLPILNQRSPRFYVDPPVEYAQRMFDPSSYRCSSRLQAERSPVAWPPSEKPNVCCIVGPELGLSIAERTAGIASNWRSLSKSLGLRRFSPKPKK